VREAIEVDKHAKVGGCKLMETDVRCSISCACIGNIEREGLLR